MSDQETYPLIENEWTHVQVGDDWFSARPMRTDDDKVHATKCWVAGGYVQADGPTQVVEGKQ